MISSQVKQNGRLPHDSQSNASFTESEGALPEQQRRNARERTNQNGKAEKQIDRSSARDPPFALRRL